MNNKEFCAEIARRLNLSQKQTTTMVKGYVEQLVERIDEAEELPFMTIGAFEVKHKDQRLMVSPTTKKRMLIPPKLVLTFKPNQTLKNQIKNL